MKILAVEDEPLLLEDLIDKIREVFPDADIAGYKTAGKTLEYLEKITAEGESLSYAFLDIQLRGTSGMELARRVKEKQPNTKLIFCTAYSKYACEAFQMHALGYIIKPVSVEQILDVLRAMDHEWNEQTPMQGIFVKTFGNFEVYLNGKQILFEREKAKELLAYLVDRQGASVRSTDIAAVLWEDEPYDRKVINKIQTIRSSLRKTLKKEGMDHMLVNEWNHLSIDPLAFRCDAYDFFKGSNRAVNAYRGEYMLNYSWAELTNAVIQPDAGR